MAETQNAERSKYASPEEEIEEYYEDEHAIQVAETELPKALEKFTGLTPIAIQNLETNATNRKEYYKRLKLKPVKKAVLIFDPERTEVVWEHSNTKGEMLFLYPVVDTRTSLREIFPAGARTSEIIDNYLGRGQNILRIRRIGTGEEVEYIVTPVTPRTPKT